MTSTEEQTRNGGMDNHRQSKRKPKSKQTRHRHSTEERTTTNIADVDHRADNLGISTAWEVDNYKYSQYRPKS